MKSLFINRNLSRRHFLSGLALLPWFSTLAKASSSSASKQTVFVNGHHDEAGSYFVSGMDAGGTESFRLPLPEMPHGFAVHPIKTNLMATFPGLTGTTMVVADVANGVQVAKINIRKNRHFNGHGTFSPDGNLLFTTENVIESSEGVIGVYDGKTFKFLREISSYGLGPHGMRVLPDGKTLVVAVGGLRTHQGTGKYYFDMNKMRSSVVFIDVKTGRLVARKEIPVHRLSIRNIYLADNDNIVVTCQYYGKREMPKVVGLIHKMGNIEMLDIDEDNLWLMKNYTGGSVVVGNTAVISCPRGNQLTFWDIRGKKFIKSIEITDVSGVQPFGDGRNFLASAETGKLYKIDMDSFEVTLLGNVWEDAKWTNHMIKAVI